MIEKLKEVFEKLALKLTRLEISSSVLPEQVSISLLNIVLNVEEISFYDVEFSDESSDAIEELNLLKLRKFKFHLCNVKIPKIVLRLPRCVLQRLSIENCILGPETLKQIFDSQTSVQELEFDPYYVNPSTMEHLKLTSMKLMCNRHVAALLTSQSQLQSLDLSKAHIDDNAFLQICNLNTLRNLRLWIDHVSWELLENLSKLHNLNELHINYDRLEVEYMRAISRIKMTNIQKLKVKFPRLKISSENFAEMSLNMPIIKHLNISNQSIGVIGALIENFKNLETLIIGVDSDSPEVVDFSISGVVHDKLKDLCIYSSYNDHKSLKCCKSILEIVNTSLRNLEKLKLQNVVTLNVDQLSDILTNHQHLTHFFIDGEATFDATSVKFLKINGKQLKYFQSRGAEISVHKKILEREFAKQFATVKIKPWKSQIVLRNCKWEHADD